jgi:hypothetical protein
VLLVSADSKYESSERVRWSGARGFVLKARLVRTDLGTFWDTA